VVKVRDGHHVRNKAAHIAVGVDLSCGGLRVLPDYALNGRVHLHSQTTPTSGSSWSSVCSKPSDTSAPVDGFGPGSV
jgi:hypothetical protein